MHVSSVFLSSCGVVSKQRVLFENKEGKQQPKHTQCLKLFVRFREGCEDLDSDQGVGDCYPLKLQKQLQKFMNCWPEAVEQT